MAYASLTVATVGLRAVNYTRIEKSSVHKVKSFMNTQIG